MRLDGLEKIVEHRNEETGRCALEHGTHRPQCQMLLSVEITLQKSQGPYGK